MTKTLLVALLAISVPIFAGVLEQAYALPYSVGDVFAGTGNGKIDVYKPDGTFVQTLDTLTASNEQTGMCFDALGNLYATSWTAGSMTKFDTNGAIITSPWGGPFHNRPESCAIDAAGNIYVGEVDSATEHIHKFDASGTLLATYSPTTGPRGVDWIDLSADQCTIYYTSEGDIIHRFDVCTNSQMADFATGLNAPCFALRERANGDVIVTCSNESRRYDSSGVLQQTYLKSALLTPTGGSEGSQQFAMNLDPDGTSFWTAAYNTGNVYRIDIATGAQLSVWTATPRVFSTAGLAIFGEPTAGGGGPAVGGEIMPINSVALMLAGIQMSAIWVVPVLAGAAGTTAFYLKTRKN